MPGFTVGILEQEPVLDDAKTALGAVEEGVAGTKALAGRCNQVSGQMAMDHSGQLLPEKGTLQEQLAHRNAWGLDSRIRRDRTPPQARHGWPCHCLPAGCSPRIPAARKPYPARRA